MFVSVLRRGDEAVSVHCTDSMMKSHFLALKLFAYSVIHSHMTFFFFRSWMSASSLCPPTRTNMALVCELNQITWCWANGWRGHLNLWPHPSKNWRVKIWRSSRGQACTANTQNHRLLPSCRSIHSPAEHKRRIIGNGDEGKWGPRLSRYKKVKNNQKSSLSSHTSACQSYPQCAASKYAKVRV